MYANVQFEKQKNAFWLTNIAIVKSNDKRQICLKKQQLCKRNRNYERKKKHNIKV